MLLTSLNYYFHMVQLVFSFSIILIHSAEICKVFDGTVKYIDVINVMIKS